MKQFNLKPVLTFIVIIAAIAAGIIYTWHLYSTGQFGQ